MWPPLFLQHIRPKLYHLYYYVSIKTVTYGQKPNEQNAKRKNAKRDCNHDDWRKKGVFLITGHYNSSTWSVKLTIFQSLM